MYIYRSTQIGREIGPIYLGRQVGKQESRILKGQVNYKVATKNL